jgi:hypothetical protein
MLAGLGCPMPAHTASIGRRCRAALEGGFCFEFFCCEDARYDSAHVSIEYYSSCSVMPVDTVPSLMHISLISRLRGMWQQLSFADTVPRHQQGAEPCPTISLGLGAQRRIRDFTDL